MRLLFSASCLASVMLLGCQSPDAPLIGDVTTPVLQCTAGELATDEILNVLAIPEAKPLAPATYTAEYGPRNAAVDSAAVLNSGDCATNTLFQYGAGIHDATGAGFDQGMAGYADNAQTSAGLHNRQWARAFVLRSNCGGRQGRVALVSVDLGLMYHSVRQSLIARIAADPQLNGIYTYDNIMVSATHSHGTAAGQAHHDLYNVMALGYDDQSHQALVEGIYQAIKKAHNNAEAASPAPIGFAQSELLNATVQRSLPAYLNNPEATRNAWLDVEGTPVTINRNSVTLSLKGTTAPVGMINWFPIHGTSMGQDNQLLTGDNKGFAATRFESDFEVDYINDTAPFVAAFVQADEGDNSPNVHINELDAATIQARDPTNPDWATRGGGENPVESTLISGTKQYLSARGHYDSPTENLTGEVSVIHAWITLGDGVSLEQAPVVEAVYDTAPYATCEPALGVGFGAGAEDGAGPTAEGSTCANSTPTDAANAAAILSGAFAQGLNGQIPPFLITPVGCDNIVFDLLGYACHAEKPILVPLATSPFDPTQAMSARTDPLQIVVIGNLAILALPFEVTTMSGRHLRAAVLDVLEDAGVDYAVIAGISNNYSHYLTTREEYASQQYEGGATIFGPWSQHAVQQELLKMAEEIRLGQPALVSGNRVAGYTTHATPFTHLANTSESPATGAAVGTVTQQPDAEYTLGDAPIVVTAVFPAGNPRTDLKQQDSYLFVEFESAPNVWEVVHTDNDWETTYSYAQNQLTGDTATVVWNVPAAATPGNYRIRHTGSTTGGAYEATTNEFVLNPCPP